MSDASIKVPLKWWMDDSGDVSFMRVAGMVALILGGVTILVGLFLAVWEEMTPTKVVAGIALVGIGSGMITGVLTAKALQRRAEAQIYATDKGNQ